jgi:ubiquinone/menaquinone biosynthesis C-methylase UbiE
MSIEQALFQLHEGLPRNSPGSEKSTLKALRRLGRMRRGARIIDMGCGTGASSLVLARKLTAEIVAVDAHEPFLETLRERCRNEDLKGSIVPRHADFAALEEPERSFDLIWSEGAAYVLGFENALMKWRALLRKGGRAAITELSWLQDQPGDEAKEYWASVYPGMRGIVANCAAAERVGFSVIDTLTMSDMDWREYYSPLKEQIARLRSEGEASPELAVVVEEAEREVAIYEAHGDEFGYVFYLLEKQDSPDDEEQVDWSEQDEPESGLQEPLSENFDESITPSRRAARMLVAGGEVGFDDGVAPSNLAAHRATEMRFAEIVGEIGLERATHLLDAIRRRVEESIRRR